MSTSLDQAVLQHLQDIGEALVGLRHELHRHPDLSGEEGPTAERVAAWLREHTSARLIEGLGGTGLAAVFEPAGEAASQTLLLRAELDALPIREDGSLDYHSVIEGVSHKCGHDGHMAMLCGVAGLLERFGADCRVVLLFQPAEETGEGARAVLADPRFDELRPDRAFALHNLPGFPEGSVVLRSGTFASASQGLWVKATGDTAHASTPHLGRSPALALARMIQELTPLAAEVLPGHRDTFITITHLAMGRPSYGVAPGAGELRATLRAASDDDLETLVRAAFTTIKRVAASEGIEAEIEHQEHYASVVNDDQGTTLVERAAQLAQLPLVHLEEPLPWSEDFGQILGRAPGALFGLGAGAAARPMHSLRYDFPDSVLTRGTLCLFALTQVAFDEPAIDDTTESES
jgi:amidohydrolase